MGAFDALGAITNVAKVTEVAQVTQVASVASVAETAVVSVATQVATAVTSVAAVATGAAVEVAQEAVEAVADVVADYLLPDLERFLWSLFNKWIDLGVTIAFYAIVFVAASLLGFLMLFIMICVCCCCTITRCYRHKVYRGRVATGELDPDEKDKSLGHARGLWPSWHHSKDRYWPRWKFQWHEVLPSMWPIRLFKRKKKDVDSVDEKGQQTERTEKQVEPQV